MKFFIFLIVLLASTPCYAERIICFDATSKQIVKKLEGDCKLSGLCSGFNNTGLDPNCIIASDIEWNSINKYVKVDTANVSNRVVPLTQPEKDALDTAETLAVETGLRIGAKSQFDGQTETGQSLRCTAEIVKNEINTLRAWTVSLKAEIAAATTLADMKTRVATLSTLNARTLAQFKTSMQSCIDVKTVDE